MAYRYCPECEQWLETAEYTVDEIGETICPEHEIAVHGYMGGSPFGLSYTVEDLRRDNDSRLYDDWGKMLQAAREQHLVERNR